jgi:hypothetical protein
MVKLRCFLVAEYASIEVDGKLIIAGTFDRLEVQRTPDAPEDALDRIPLARAYIAVVTEASIADGLTHAARLHIVDGDGEPIADDTPMTIDYSLNRLGLPMRHNLVISIAGLVLPGPDDYVFQLYLDDETVPLGESIFSVTERTDPA